MGCSIQKSAQWWGASNADPGCPLLERGGTTKLKENS